mgnify:CR=1 FL=1
MCVTRFTRNLELISKYLDSSEMATPNGEGGEGSVVDEQIRELPSGQPPKPTQPHITESR